MIPYDPNSQLCKKKYGAKYHIIQVCDLEWTSQCIIEFSEQEIRGSSIDQTKMSLTVYKILSFIPSMEAFHRHETFFYGIFGEMKESMSGPSTKRDLPPKVILLNGSSWAKYKGTTMT